MPTNYTKKADQIFAEYQKYITSNGIIDLFEQSFYLITLLSIKYRYIILLEDAKYIDAPYRLIERTIANNQVQTTSSAY